MLTDDLKLFLAIADAGSLSAAARLNRTSPSTVSRRISSLEEQLGTKLASITTRHFSLTAAGRILVERGTSIVREIDDLREALVQMQSEPNGLLRVSASVGFGGRYIAPLLGEFRRRCPNIWIDLRLEDELSDLAAGEADVAIRIGRLADSQLRHVSLAPLHRIACASPNYLMEYGRPRTPMELAEHDCIMVSSAGQRGGAWRFRGVRALKLEPRISVSSHEAAAVTVLSGAGIAHLPSWLISAELRTGRLERLLGEYENASAGGVHLLWQNRAPARVQAFVTFIREKIRPEELTANT